MKSVSMTIDLPSEPQPVKDWIASRAADYLHRDNRCDDTSSSARGLAAFVVKLCGKTLS